jgi:hypothetical protein
MRNNRQLVGGFVLAAMIASAMPLRADVGGPGGPARSTCTFLQGILLKVGNPELLAGIFERVFECEL